MAKQYKWRMPMFGGLSAQTVGSHLERMSVKVALTPTNVVDDARSPRSPLHKYFEWDDAVAADSHRRQQARVLLGNLIVDVRVRGRKPVSVRAFVSVSKESEQQYADVETAFADPDLRKQVLSDALAEVTSWKMRYSELQELTRIFSAIELVQGELPA